MRGDLLWLVSCDDVPPSFEFGMLLLLVVFLLVLVSDEEVGLVNCRLIAFLLELTSKGSWIGGRPNVEVDLGEKGNHLGRLRRLLLLLLLLGFSPSNRK